MGVNVVAANNSWGGYSVDTLYTLIADDLYENGIVVLKASANSAKDHDVLPSDDVLSDHMVLVNAIDSEGQLANFSDYGASSTDVAAPGVSIFSTVMDRDGAPDLDDESVVVKDGETPLKGTFIDMFGSSESIAFEVKLQDVGPTVDASAEVSVDSYGNFAWDMTLYPDDSSVISLTANKPISAEAVQQINYLAFSSYAQSDIGGGFYVSLSAKCKEKDAAGNYERVELDSVGINQGSDGAYLTALTSLTDEQKDAIDWENFTLYMSRTNTSSSDTWDLTFNFNACAFVSHTTPYTYWDGTSMATPVASGVAALIAQDLSDKGLSAEQQAAEVRARLIGGAIRDNDSLMGTSQSDGRLDVKKALEDPNPVITEVNQSKENPASATISGFFFGSSPSIEIINADAPDAKALQLSVGESSTNEDGSRTYNVTLPEGMKEGSYYVKATNADNSNWGRMKLSLKAVPESSESGEEDPDNPSVTSDYFEVVSSLSNDMTNLEGVPNGKKVGRTGYLTTPINVQSIGSKMYVMTCDFYLVDSEAPEYEDEEATYLLFVYDTETQAWSVDQNLVNEDYVPCVSMAASGDHLYLIFSDGVQDYNTKDGSLNWIIGEKGTNTLAVKYGFNSRQNEFLYSATSYVNGDELWITCVNKETLDGDVESYEFLNSVLVFDLSNPSADAKVMSSVNAGRAGSALLNVNGAMYLTPGGAFDSDFAFQEYVAMEALGKGATEWTLVAEFPVALDENQEYIAASAASDGKIIISGLRANDAQGNGVVPDTYIYDTANNTWSIAEKQLASHKITGAQGLIANDGYFYVLGADVQDTGSLLTVKRCKASDLLELSEDPDNPKDPEESDEPDDSKGPEESEDQNGPDTGEGITPDGNPSSDTGEKDALPQTSDPLRDYTKALAALVVVGAIGTIVAAVQSRRMRVGKHY